MDNPLEAESLRKLSAAYYIFAGVQMFYMLFGVTFFGIALAMIARPEWFQGTDAPAIIMNSGAMTFGLLFSLASIGFAFVTFRAGKAMKERRSYPFCKTVAIINCFWVPLGTILGLISLRILKRPGVQGLFNS